MNATAKRHTFADDSKTAELTAKWKTRDLLPLVVHEVRSVNFDPHPFMIGPRHVENAAKCHGGMLGHETIVTIPCADKGCRLMAREHTFDVVLIVKLTRNATKDEVQAVLKPICNEVESDGIDGFTFLETPQKFRIT